MRTSAAEATASGSALIVTLRDVVLRWYGAGTTGPEEPHEMPALAALD